MPNQREKDMNRRYMQCGYSVVAIGEENSLADKEEKARRCEMCEKIACEYREKYMQPNQRLSEELKKLYNNAISLEDCIEFTGTINNGGYGVVRLFGKQRLAHVVAFKLFNPRSFIKNKCICHKCDNKKCINPEHLFLGTRIENNRDRDMKGRNVVPLGERNGGSKLLTKDVIKIKYKLSKGVSLADLGREFNVRWQTIQAIAKGITWKTI